MAAKSQGCACFSVFVSLLLSVGLSVGFIYLRNNCLSKANHTFVVGSYCKELTSSRVASIASALIEALAILLAVNLSNAVCAYRTKRLETGMPEGVYVALGGRSWKYQVAAMLTRYWSIVGLVILLTYGPAVIQPMLAFSESPQVIYQAPHQKTEYWESIDNRTPYVHASASNSPGKHQSVYNTTPAAIALSRNYNNKTRSGPVEDVLIGLADLYSTAANGFPVAKSNQTVTTGVLRSGIISSKYVFRTAPSAAQLVFEYGDTFANVTTDCSENFYGISFNNTPRAPAVNGMTWKQFQVAYAANSTALGPSSHDGSRGVILSFEAGAQIPGEEGFTGRVAVSRFQASPSGAALSSQMCSTVVNLREGRAIVNVHTQNITTLSTWPAPVDFDLFRALVTNLTLAPFTPVYRSAYQNTGFFSKGDYSFMHSRVCAAVSVALQRMHFSNGYYITLGHPKVPILNATYVFNNYADVSEESDNMILYAPVIKLYMSRTTAWFFAILLGGLNVLLCICAMHFMCIAKMNVKGFAENAFFDNLTMEDIVIRRGMSPGVVLDDKIGPQAVAGALPDRSNNEDAQRKHAFASTLYASETFDKGDLSGVRVGFSKGIPLRAG